jgi:hypothetical protein
MLGIYLLYHWLRSPAWGFFPVLIGYSRTFLGKALVHIFYQVKKMSWWSYFWVVSIFCIIRIFLWIYFAKTYISSVACLFNYVFLKAKAFNFDQVHLAKNFVHILFFCVPFKKFLYLMS